MTACKGWDFGNFSTPTCRPQRRTTAQRLCICFSHLALAGLKQTQLLLTEPHFSEGIFLEVNAVAVVAGKDQWEWRLSLLPWMPDVRPNSISFSTWKAIYPPFYQTSRVRGEGFCRGEKGSLAFGWSKFFGWGEPQEKVGKQKPKNALMGTPPNSYSYKAPPSVSTPNSTIDNNPTNSFGYCQHYPLQLVMIISTLRGLSLPYSSGFFTLNPQFQRLQWGTTIIGVGL